MLRAVSRGGWVLLAPIILSINDYATYSVLITTLYIVSTVATLGTAQTILRERAESVSIRVLSAHAFLLAAALTFLIALAVPRFTGEMFLLVSVGVIGLILRTVANAHVKARLAFQRAFVSETAAMAVLAAGIIGLVVTELLCDGSCTGYATVAAVEIVAAYAAVVVLLARRDRAQDKDAGPSLRMLPSIYRIGLLVVLDAVIFYRLEVYFLGASPGGSAAISVFALSVQLSSLALIAPAAALESWYPQLAQLFQDDRRAFREMLSAKNRAFIRGYGALAMMSVPVTLLLVWFVFEKYQEWTVYIVAFVAIRVGSGFFWFYSNLLYATKRETWLYVPAGVGSAVSLGGNIALTLQYGLPGALAAYATTHVVVGALTVVAYRRVISADIAES